MKLSGLARTRTGWLAIGIALALAAPVFGGAGSVLTLGPMDILALDQPRVQIGLEDLDNLGEVVGPLNFNDGLLDTGANGLLLGQLAYYDDNFIVDPDLYDLARRPDDSIVQYEEIGVAGTQLLDVLEPHNFYFAGADTITRQLPAVNVFGDSSVDLGGWAAVVGMPAMAGRVTTLNLLPMSEFEFIEVAFSPTRPAATPHGYHVSLTMLEPEHTGQQQPGDPLPTFAALPLVENVRTWHNGLVASDTMLLDTGAQVSMITTATALQMGIDPETDAIDYLEVGGIGGTQLIPIVEVDRMALPTAEGVDLHLTNLQVGVLDIPGLGGILGMNALTSGYLDGIFSGDPGFIESVILDFTEAEGVMRLDLLAPVDTPVLKGDVGGDGFINALDLSVVGANWLASGVDWSLGDFNFDTIVNALDLSALGANWGLTASGGGVTFDKPAPGLGGIPEPASVLLLATSAGLLLGRRRRNVL